MTWPRLVEALHHERWVLSQVRPRVDVAEPFGQALFSETLRGRLKRCETLPGYPSLIRWIPDIICIKQLDVHLIEAKAGQKWKTTGNHGIEKSSLAAADRWRYAFSIDVWFIFSDGRAASLEWLMRYPGRREGSFLGEGSGTSFWLWPRAEMIQMIEPTPPHIEGCPVCEDASAPRLRESA